jgi:putative hydrolase of the HAD superfamily
MPRPTAVLFDLDDTLTDRRKSIERYCAVFLEEFGSRLPPLQPTRLEELIVSADRWGYNPLRPQDICRSLPWQTVPAETAIDTHWNTYFPISVVQRSGMTGVIEWLQEKCISIGIVTNGTTRAQQAKMQVLGLHESADVVVVSETEGFKKPDPRLFRVALRRLGEDAGSAWFVGDHPNNDILGAQVAGLTAVWLRGNHPWPKEHPAPQLQIECLSELPRLVGAE